MRSKRFLSCRERREGRIARLFKLALGCAVCAICFTDGNKRESFKEVRKRTVSLSLMERPAFKPGDWICAQCKTHNYRSKSVCFGCDLFQSKSLRLAGARDNSSAARLAPYPQRPPPERKRGDWDCTTCSKLNFASRTICYSCKTHKPDSLPASLPAPSPPSQRPASSTNAHEDSCIVCMDAQPGTVVVSCGHMIMCEACACKLTKCPACNCSYDPHDKAQLAKIFRM